VSPILVRPVREQLEHDRVIRLLQAKFRRRFDVGINPGSEQNSAVGSGAAAVYPDVVLQSPERGRKVLTVIEVETAESVNNLEALAQWVPLGRLKYAFHLYVPTAVVDVARRLCSDSNIPVAEIHTYHWVGDEMRFTPVYRAPADGRAKQSDAAAARMPATRSEASRRRTPGRAAAKSRKKLTSKPVRITARRSAGKSIRKSASLRRK
jgi:hypothetical protein